MEVLSFSARIIFQKQTNKNKLLLLIFTGGHIMVSAAMCGQTVHIYANNYHLEIFCFGCSVYLLLTHYITALKPLPPSNSDLAFPCLLAIPSHFPLLFAKIILTYAVSLTWYLHLSSPGYCPSNSKRGGWGGK